MTTRKKKKKPPPLDVPPAPSQGALRKRARRLAASLGCTIEPERVYYGAGSGGFHVNYWVFGPADVYEYADADGDRADPHDGDHCATDWQEVLDRLEAYGLDLAYHRLGLDDDATGRINDAC